MSAIYFTRLELEAIASAAEYMVERVSEGDCWENEPPETLQALKRATKKVMTEYNLLWSEVKP